MMRFDWTDEVVARVGVLLRKGYGSAEIAIDIGCPTRNAVIGKVYRDKRLKGLGLAAPGGRPRKNPEGYVRVRKPVDADFKARKQKLRAEKVKTVKPKLVAVPVLAPIPLNLTLTELGPHNCRWPVNDAAVGEPHFFCGAEAEECKPYCSHHLSKAFGRGTESERSATRMAIHLGRKAA